MLFRSISMKMSARDLCRGFDSVSVCLSKGLGAPAGTLLLGNADLMARARRARKILGGAMRQAGVIAAAGLYALENNVERLAEDHANAGRLAKGLHESGYEVEGPHTNMVFVRIPPERLASLKEKFEQERILILPGPRLRLVTHLDVDAAGIERAIEAFSRCAAAA